ncbi:acid-sensing ion channel 1C-like [Diadema antillarum]|uniref:acid-sensing ion channel 1C-like n=1 Tax=Diadema antillarum TaxID=105358 RepID=UPI003A865C56
MSCKPGKLHIRHWAAEVTDFHGLKHVAGNYGGAFRRIVWLLLFLLALGYCTYQCALVIITYRSHSHVTKIDVEYETEVSFPAITVCNFNKYRESAFTDDDIKNVGVHLGIIDEDHDLIYPNLYTDEFRDFLDNVNWTAVEEDSDYNMTEFTTRTGHQIEDLVVSCDWDDQECEEGALTSVLTHLGNCFTFNAQTDGSDKENWFVSKSAGAANGLRLVLNLETPEYTPSNDLDGGASDAGFRVMLHYPTEPPYPKELGFSVAPGMHTTVSMRYEHITSLAPPFSTCEDEGTDIITHFDHYSLQACRIECETRVVLAECGCRLPEQPGDEEVCGPAETHECAHSTLREFIAGTLDTDETCECKSPCIFENYPFTATQSKLRSSFLEKLYSNSSNNFTTEYIDNNIAIISFYYEALNYETIEMLPEYTLPTLLAVIGGNMGLFLGASALTVVQFGEYIVDEISGWCVCGKKKNNAKVNGETAKVEPVQTVSAKDAWSDGNV